MIALLWLAMHVQPMLACAGTSDELRDSVLPAVMQGRCDAPAVCKRGPATQQRQAQTR